MCSVYLLESIVLLGMYRTRVLLDMLTHLNTPTSAIIPYPFLFSFVFVGIFDYLDC